MECDLNNGLGSHSSHTQIIYQAWHLAVLVVGHASSLSRDAYDLN